MDAPARGAGSLRRLGGLLYPYRWRVALAFGLTALACALNLLLPLLLQGLIDRAVASDGGAWPRYAGGLVAAYSAQAGVGLAATLVIGGVGLNVVRDLRHRLYAHLQTLGLRFYDTTPDGAVIARLTDDVAAVQALVTTQTLTILTELGTALAVAALLLWQSPRLFLVAVCFLPAYVFNSRLFTGRVRAGSAAVRERLDTIFSHLKEKLDGALVVQASARERAEVAEFGRRLAAAHAPRLSVGRLGAAFGQVSTALGGVATAAVFSAAAFEVLHGRLTPGGAVATVALAALLFGPASRCADLVNLVAQAGASLRRVGALLDLPAEANVPARPAAVKVVAGRVEFDRVAFGYLPGRPVVWDVRLTIEPGQKLALVGPTGCGKSTLVNLLLRFYEPTWGEIRLDGRSLRDFDPAWLRSRIGVVPQDAVVFRGTVADNIRYGAPDADDGRLIAAARAALVDDFVRALPGGYQTIVGAGGHRLSQGERQRLAIARALCKDPALVILDEATSSLDTAGEAQIQAALDNLLRDRTAIIVAHRLATVVHADRIVVMDGGLIEQAGTHAELLAEAGGLYRRLCDAQFGSTPSARAPRLFDPTSPRIPPRRTAGRVSA
jgi:ABC-type multidrug transport system fused ATPase/permease subunit